MDPIKLTTNSNHYVANLILTQDFFPKIGGAHLWLYEVYKRWPCPVVVLTQDYAHSSLELLPQQAQFDSLNHGSIEIFRRDLETDDINLLSPKYLKQLFKIQKIIRDISGGAYLILHCLRAFPEGIAALVFQLLRRRKCKFVTYAHGEEVLIAKTSRQLHLLARLVYKNSDLVIANSHSTMNLVKGLVPDAKVAVIHPGVDVAAFDVSEKHRMEYRQQWGWSQETAILITVARMEKRKNQAAVIRAINDLLKEGVPLAYLVAGAGPEEANLRNLVNKLGLNDRIRFLGKISEEEKRHCFTSSDIHVMPSIQVGPMIEGFGIVFLEAAAASIPSIAGNVGGQSEAVIHGKTGYVINGFSLKELKAAIKLLAENKNVRERMGLEAKIWAKKYDWDNVAKKIFFEIEESRHE